MSQWSDHVDPPHPEWTSTKSFQSTGKSFGIIDALLNMATHNDLDDDSASDQSLNEGAEVAAQKLLELEAAMVDDDEHQLVMDHMPALLQWLTAIHKRDRPFGEVKEREEWKYVNTNVTKYQQGGDSDEADKHSSISF